MFVGDVFDNFSSISKNGIIELGLNEVDMYHDWNKNLYYIEYELKFKYNDVETNSKAIFGIDELTSLYFKD
jgi:hypothetical protein